MLRYGLYDILDDFMMKQNKLCVCRIFHGEFTAIAMASYLVCLQNCIAIYIFTLQIENVYVLSRGCNSARLFDDLATL